MSARANRMRAAGSRQPLADDHADPTRSTAVDQYFALLRKCVHDCGWTIEALSTEMAIDKAHLWRLLHNEKPWRTEHLLALPDDIEALFEARRAEQLGHVVVAPLEGDEAVKALVGGLVGVLRGTRLPARAARMAKCDLPSGGDQ